MIVMSNVLLTLRRDNAPVPLSSGVLLVGTGSTNKLVTLTAVSAENGIVELPLNDPIMSPHSTLMQRAWAAPYAKGDADRFARLAANRSLKFVDLSDAHLFWVEAKTGYTHVLMEAHTRRMVGVKPLKMAGAVWRPLAEASEDPAAFMKNAGPFDNRELGRTLDMVKALAGRKVYACLHPAPVNSSGAALWCFDGIDQVGLVKDDDSWETAFVEAVEREDAESGVFA